MYVLNDFLFESEQSPGPCCAPAGPASSAGFVPQVVGKGCSSRTTRHSDDSTVCNESEPSHPRSQSSQCWQHT